MSLSFWSWCGTVLLSDVLLWWKEEQWGLEDNASDTLSHMGTAAAPGWSAVVFERSRPLQGISSDQGHMHVSLGICFSGLWLVGLDARKGLRLLTELTYTFLDH